MKDYLLVLTLFSFSIVASGQIAESQAIDSIFAEWDKPDNPGCALGIIKNGELIYAKGYGLANMEYDIPNSPSSVFRIGSTSKQFTAACIVMLAEQGELSLDATLKSIFYDFPDYAEKITIRHLLNHTSGIRDYLQLAYLKGLGVDDYFTDEDVMEWLVMHSDLNFNPGEEFLYSNSGYWLLGQVVQKVTGMNLADFAKGAIFEPLEMNNTHFHNNHTRIVRNRATGYAPRETNEFAISMTTLGLIGDGGVFTTIDDIKKWDDAFYDSNALSSAFWAEMTKQGVLNDGATIEYAAGLIIGAYKGLKTIRHGGAFVGFRAELLRFPEEHLTIAIFANRGDANPSKMANQVADLMLKRELKEGWIEEGEPSSSDRPMQQFKLDQLIGNYEIQPGVAFHLTVQNDALNVIQTWNKTSYDIIRINGNTFQIPGEKELSFTFSDLSEGYAQTLLILQDDRTTSAKRKKVADVSGIDLNHYTGSFYSEELDVTYSLRVEGGILKADIDQSHLVMDLSTSGLDEFVMEFGLLRFVWSTGVVSGFELDSGRVKNVRFEKK